MLTFTIDLADHLRTPAGFLWKLIPEAPAGYVRKLIDSNHMAVERTRPGQTFLAVGDVVRIKESSRLLSLLRKKPFPVELLDETPDLVVVNKPSGVAMHHTGREEPTVVGLVKDFLARKGILVTPRPVNRLDRGTSGVVILAKGGKAAGVHGRIVKEVGLGKRYLALVDGRVTASGEVSVPIDGKEAVTTFSPLVSSESRSLVIVTPHTGRMHQIRIHLALTGHPITGDVRYGGTSIGERGTFFLHSLQTTLLQGDLVQTFTAPLPHPFVGEIGRSFPGESESIWDRLLQIVSTAVPVPKR